MDKSDSRLHIEQIEKLMAAGKYSDAAFLADKVDWRKEEDNKKLIEASEVYRKNERYDDCINILKIAHNRKPNNKKVVYLLCEVYFEKKDVVTAQVYLDRFQSMTDRTDWHYDALKYKRALAYDLPVSEKVDILQALKKKEPAAEKFRYELAVLLKKAKRYAECAAECDELLILFGDDGTYARKSLELKKSCVDLSDDQEELLRKLTLGEVPEGPDNVNLMNTMEINKIDLENILANDIRNLKSEDSKNTVKRRKPNLNTGDLRQTIPPSNQEIFFNDHTKDLRQFTQEINVEKYDIKPNREDDMQEITMPADAYEESIDDILAGEYEEDALEENVPGQITMDDLLSDWTKIKERNTQDLKNSIHKNVVEQTGRIFEKKTNTGEIFEDEPAGSIWDEVDRVDEFEEDLSDNEVYEEAEEAYTEAVIEEPVVEEPVAEVEEAYTQESVAQPEYADNTEEDSYDEEPDLDVVMKNDDAQEEDEEAAEDEEEIPEEEDGKSMDLTPEERKLFAPFLYSRQMKAQIVNALENISLASYEGNVLITCDNKESGFALAKTIVKFMKYADSNFTGAMSKITAEKFNVKNVSEVMGKLANGALVIEDANKLSNNSLIKLTQAINQEERGILLFLVDTRKEMKHLLGRQRTLTDFFNIRIDIIAMSEDSLVDYGMKYANNLGYSIEEGFANLAFHKRVREAQAGNHIMTVAEVKEIVDEAIDNNGKNFFSKFARRVTGKLEDDNGMIMLREKDFN
ncbi:MAG: hypothetical protein MJ126_09505 [Lachnospiraceae bacterium]|nr:hypothetical protein [Lachnospiraceae bacterium]